MELSDSQAEELLRLILVAITEYGNTDKDMTILDFVEDIAMSMDTTSNAADTYRREIEENLT